jgi:hypothetical protein
VYQCFRQYYNSDFHRLFELANVVRYTEAVIESVDKLPYYHFLFFYHDCKTICFFPGLLIVESQSKVLHFAIIPFSLII